MENNWRETYAWVRFSLHPTSSSRKNHQVQLLRIKLLCRLANIYGYRLTQWKISQNIRSCNEMDIHTVEDVKLKDNWSRKNIDYLSAKDTGVRMVEFVADD